MKTFGGIVVLMLVLTGCTGGDGGSDKKPEVLKRDDTSAKAAWTADLDPIGQPVVTGKTAVVISKASGKRLEIVGVDTTSGKIAWRYPVGPNNVPSGIPLIPQLTANSAGEPRVVFYRAPKKPRSITNEDLFTPITVVDPATGKVVATSPKLWSTNTVSPCDDGTDVCVSATLTGKADYDGLRVDVETGKVSPSNEGPPDDARLIGKQGLFASYGDENGLGVARGGKTLWEKSFTEIFGAKRSTGGGWALLHESEADRYTGWVGPDNKGADSRKGFVYDIGDQRLASFDGKTGRILWSKVGADTCFKPTDLDDESSVGTVKHPIRCAVTGTIAYKGEKSTPNGVTMVIEGYDPDTGKTKWKHRVPDAAATAYYADSPRPLVRGGETIVATLAKGPMLIETATGKTVKAVGTFACQNDAARFEYVVPHTSGDDEFRERTGTGLITPCGPDGTPSTKGFTVSSVKEAGIKVSDTSSYVMSTPDGLVGFNVGKG